MDTLGVAASTCGSKAYIGETCGADGDCWSDMCRLLAGPDQMCVQCSSNTDCIGHDGGERCIIDAIGAMPSYCGSRALIGETCSVGGDCLLSLRLTIAFKKIIHKFSNCRFPKPSHVWHQLRPLGKKKNRKHPHGSKKSQIDFSTGEHCFFTLIHVTFKFRVLRVRLKKKSF